MAENFEETEIMLPQAFRDELLMQIRAYGPIRDNGFHELNEQLYPEIDDFKVVFYSNESQHRGRLHCGVVVHGKTANVDLKTCTVLVSRQQLDFVTPLIRQAFEYQVDGEASSLSSEEVLAS